LHSPQDALVFACDMAEGSFINFYQIVSLCPDSAQLDFMRRSNLLAVKAEAFPIPFSELKMNRSGCLM
jgi:hypothetical protein